MQPAKERPIGTPEVNGARWEAVVELEFHGSKVADRSRERTGGMHVLPRYELQIPSSQNDSARSSAMRLISRMNRSFDPGNFGVPGSVAKRIKDAVQARESGSPLRHDVEGFF